ncbi:DUF29 domain-containing protein [Gloeocapsa sp. PCC 73106]|uniref:DUF29 domain-containing protein n=1 Tax=Gloeocapsa sp. PCC 73106 TaxID=102232 RepID=UPI0002ACC7E7|nr:DUF29 domain-containing protein [Gloeocapsa sp. PCC 73106]ELR97334.1 protein of unknown function DUF29 [Gloeocapsa sp. PCC 73106]
MSQSMKTETYETDFYQWTIEQAQALRERKIADLDWENVIEEIEALGRSDYSAVASLMLRQLEHHLKIDYTPLEECYKKWQVEIEAFKIGIKRKISPSMKPKLKEELEEIYQDAVKLVSLEYGVELPEKCPYTLEELLP